MDRERALGELKKIVSGSDWGLLPKVRKDWGRNWLTTESWQVAGSLVRAVALTEVYWGGDVEKERLDGLRDCVYRGEWNPKEEGAVEALIDFRPREGKSIVDFKIGDWEVRPCDLAVVEWKSKNPERGELLSRVLALVDRFGKRGVAGCTTSLDVWESVVVYKSLGILEPNLSWKEFATERAHRATSVLFDILSRSLDKIEDFSTDKFKTVNDRWIRSNLEVVIGQLGGMCSEGTISRWPSGPVRKWLDQDSARVEVFKKIRLMEESRRNWVLERLTNKERKVLCLVIGYGAGHLAVREIEDRAGVDRATVYSAFDSFMAIVGGRWERYIGTDGVLLMRNQLPSPIIDMARKFKESDWAKLPADYRRAARYFFGLTDGGFCHTVDEFAIDFRNETKSPRSYLMRLTLLMKKVLNSPVR